jgi:hypothetical protein
MKMSEHTPGPWRFDRDWTRTPTIFGANGVRVADVEKKLVVTGGRVIDLPKEEREANARLIAAAPDMLAILQRISVSYPGYIPDFVEAVHAVIAKATRS